MGGVFSEYSDRIHGDGSDGSPCGHSFVGHKAAAVAVRPPRSPSTGSPFISLLCPFPRPVPPTC
ncbi:conserved hypothetical protein [Ricinus communis]|uniref:Uncharacterized protein n=1 Tax=Ricinus communis TaxID=3988 RepID=B9S5T0_RICCO|nr:conserved hypothetical protein [Ricinus communis]